MRLNDRERVKLLASSYLDVCEGDKGEHETGRVVGFKELGRSRIWREGSYAEFEQASNTLRDQLNPAHRWFWRVYVTRTARILDLAPHKKHLAEQSLTYVVKETKRRGHGNIFVPLEISENAGFSEVEAKAARKPRLKLAA